MTGGYLFSNQCQVWLPMRFSNHDPVNSKTLNVGRLGSAGDAAFGAGAAEPTKLDYRRGYEFDGGDYFTISSFASGTYSVGMLLDIGVTDGKYLFDATGGAGTGGCHLVGAVITPTTGTVYQDGESGHTTLQVGLRTIVITGMTLDPSTNLIVGADNAGANGMVGSLHQFFIADFALTPTQVWQAHIEALRRFNKV